MIRALFIKGGGFVGGFGCSAVGNAFAGEAGAWIGGLSFSLGVFASYALLKVLRP